jgi:acyl-coenzyme A thioesterase PaaI-like protein
VVGFELDGSAISVDEYERLAALYGPLAQAVRELVDATVRTDADEDTIHDVSTRVQAVTDALRRGKLSESSGVRHILDGRAVAWGNAVIGLRNPIAPPLTVQHDGDGRCWTEFALGAAYEGPPGMAHGGVCALVLDHLLGEAASDGLTKPRFTGTITVKYLRGTPLGKLRGEAAVQRSEDVKTFVRGHLSDEVGVTVEAEGVFILPAWAR